MIRRALFLAAALGLAVPAAADPRPRARGDRSPPEIAVKTDTPLAGPLAPRRARQWLLVLAPSFVWSDGLDTARIRRESRTAIAVDIDVMAAGSVTGVELRVYGDLIAVAETGVCCCGSCVAAIHFFAVRGGAIADVTDEVWPRFRHVTDIGTTFEALRFALDATSIEIRGGDNRALYRLRRDRRSGRFEVSWRRRGTEPPFSRSP